MNKVLFIEDSDSTRNAVKNYLKLYNYNVTACRCLTEAQQILNRELPDLAIIDVNLPDGNGFFFAKEYVSETQVPFVFLTSKGDESDVITGFEQGAADYIVKPFSMKEMVLRIESILGRYISRNEKLRRVWFLDNDRLEMNKETHVLSLNGTTVLLTPMEWEILTILCSGEGGILSREYIRSILSDRENPINLKTIDSHVRNIRQKLHNPSWINCIRGFGFRFTGKPCYA